MARRERKRKSILVVIVLLLIIGFTGVFLGMQYLKKTGLFKHVGTITYDDSLTETERGFLSDYFTDDFEIANDRYYNYQFLLEEINKISTELLTEVMTTLITAYKITSLKIIKDAPILSLILFDKDEITLFYFKRFGRLKPKDNAFVRMILSKQQISQIKFVSLVRKNAAAYSFNHAYDNIALSLHDFFLKFFKSHSIIFIQNINMA